MVLQHEYQHNETILQTLQLKKGDPYRAPRQVSFAARKPVSPEMVSFGGGQVSIGTDDRSSAYDNERPKHMIDLPPFQVDRYPVSNAQFLEFIRDKGYEREEFWSDGGRRWLAESGATAPKYWSRAGDGWTTQTMDITRPLDLTRPVCHVCYYEAEAFAAWAGKRLPTEAEWEVAASWNPSAGRAQTFPWGDAPADSKAANIDQLAFDTAPIGTHDRNVSPIGCYGMIGDVWEWTSGDFTGYSGFESFPYKEYSEEFFGPDYKILRGGSWATRPGAIRNTFRNWDYPIRRQIFSGFRCAQDA
jgi:gamma-glutamyl hercynylcysteine S-oxide synthase